MSAQMNKILDEIRMFPHAFDFTKNTLAYWIAEVVANAIWDAMDTESDPDGAGWPALSEGYAAWKSEHYPGLPMGVLERLMKDMSELQGDMIISPTKFYQTYGVTEMARDHAAWFQDPVNANQPPRPFYALNTAALQAIADVLDSIFEDAIR
jgi:phage gpG-like protein